MRYPEWAHSSPCLAGSAYILSFSVDCFSLDLFISFEMPFLGAGRGEEEDVKQ